VGAGAIKGPAELSSASSQAKGSAAAAEGESAGAAAGADAAAAGGASKARGEAAAAAAAAATPATAAAPHVPAAEGGGSITSMSALSRPFSPSQPWAPHPFNIPGEQRYPPPAQPPAVA